LAVKHFIDVGAGVIDEDYTGLVGVVLFNHSEADFPGRKEPNCSLGCSVLAHLRVGLSSWTAARSKLLDIHIPPSAVRF
jgi:hypothetical protein